ncbi:hypothetical protein FHS07_002612 [Microbacterium proteolyticum]|uniref:Uncharacterized protein n=1 Tax=Microbacterium proteolyticum TaxID=1572644 RepID=A0A7W5CKA1_9MICO|nr:hypothetical protein [Microbacterium proteolyticum]MBB3158894.1 hypothetical protein [Microbacterium proteolyticum]
MTDTPDAAGGDVQRVVPVPSTGSEAVAVPASGKKEFVDAAGTPGTPQMAEPIDASSTPTASPARQPVVRVRGSRRARLLPAPGTTAEPAPADDRERGRGSKPAASGPNDDRMLGDVPPHY